MTESIYQPLEHPDYQDCEVTQPCIERWEMIYDELPSNGESLIDIGCHTGWFCRMFSHLGWKVLGVDTKQDKILIAQETMKKYNGNPPPEYLVAEVTKMELDYVDVALCLSVVMYWFNPQFGGSPELGWKTLNHISETSDIMFLDHGGQYDTLPKNFPAQLLTRTRYTRCKLLGYTDFENRPLYKFWRE